MRRIPTQYIHEIGAAAHCLLPHIADGNCILVSGRTAPPIALRKRQWPTRFHTQEFGGHFVLGHVDTTGRVTHLTPEGENWWLGVEVPEDFAPYVVPKGSVTIDGISLTVARWQNRIAEIAVIPYTYAHTNLSDRKRGDAVNLEGDILGKYVERHLEARRTQQTSSLQLSRLIEEGF